MTSWAETDSRNRLSRIYVSSDDSLARVIMVSVLHIAERAATDRAIIPPSSRPVVQLVEVKYGLPLRILARMAFVD